MIFDWDAIESTLHTEETIEFLLGLREPDDIEQLRRRAEALTLERIGNRVHYRGLIEFSNVCSLNCRYCGIRRDNDRVERYTLTQREILEAAEWCAQQGYGSIVLQSGENPSTVNVDFLCDTIEQIKQQTITETLPEGLGITLSLGVHSRDVYRRWFASGAHRYLLRVETTDPDLFALIHPPEQTLQERMDALHELRAVGYQVGTGVMIGLPGQTLRHLARDILFFRDFDIDMVGMGPYQPHADTPMAAERIAPAEQRLQLALNMIAVTRLLLRTVNIASTTALQALLATGRELGVSYGANITMPNLTPTEARRHYQLYDGKPCVDEGKEECRGCLLNRMRSVGREVAFDEWGDSQRFVESGRGRPVEK